MIAYKYRLYPNKSQQAKLWLHANKLNRLYNYFLGQRKEAYENGKQKIVKKQQQAELVKLKQDDFLLQEIHSQVIQQVTDRLDKTYKVFFKHHKNGQGYPKFRNCRKFFGITYPQKGYSIQDNIIITKVYGNIKFKQHIPLKGEIKQITITFQDNKWYICIITDYIKSKKDACGIIGIDVGVTNFVATSNGEIIKNKSHAKYFDKQINKLKSRRDSQCKKKSRKFKHLCKVIQRLYDAKNRKIKDFQHKVSKNLSMRYDTIIVEDLELKKMSEGNWRGLNREIRNSCLGQFIQFLSYKTNELLKVNPYRTSKTCCLCGKIHNMPLNKRIMDCNCGNKLDRDENAARNILCLGQAIIFGLCTVEATLQEAFAFRQG